jgi:hypothetical protein
VTLLRELLDQVEAAQTAAGLRARVRGQSFSEAAAGLRPGDLREAEGRAP